MFEVWRRSRIEKRFRRLKFTWKLDCVEVTPFLLGKEYSIKFIIHRTFISFNQLRSLLKVIDDVFITSWNPNELPSTFRLNDSTIGSAKFVKQLLTTELSAEIKLILAVTGAYAVKHLGLEKTLSFLSKYNRLYSRESFKIHTDSSEDLATRAFIIFPGVDYSLDDRRTVSLNEVEKFFASEQGLVVAQFLTFDQDNDLSFGKFRQMSIETLNYATDRKFSASSLLVALEIVENTSMEIMDQITAEQLLSLSSEIRPGQAALYPMDVILSRPRMKEQHKSREDWPKSKIRCLDVLTEFVTPEELSILEQQAKELDLIPRLSRFALFDSYGIADPKRPYGSTAPILSVLAEIAVTKGVNKYSEVVEVIEGIFPTRYRNWETLVPEVRVNLVDLTLQILNDDYDEIILRWVLAMTGHLPFEVGPECRYDRGFIRMIVS